MSKLKLLLLITFVLLGIGTVTAKPIVSADVNYNNVMDDAIFDNVGTMDANAIDAFLNTFPNSCISTNNGFSAPDPTGYSPSTKFTYGNNVSAGTVIFHAAQAYGINPQVLIVDLQKEQGLIVGDGGNVIRSGTDCGALAISASMGYNCPDSLKLTSYSGFELYAHNGNPVTSVSNTCVENASYVGFTRQVIIAAWQLTFDRHRSEGLNNWFVNKPGWNNSDDLSFCYSQRTISGGPFYLCPDTVGHSSDPYVSHSGQYNIDGTIVTIFNGATAALYNYTPHLHGQQLFTTSFNAWFGATTSVYSINVTPISNITNMVGRVAVLGFTTTRKPAWPVDVRLTNSNTSEGALTSNDVVIQPGAWNDPSQNTVTLYAQNDGTGNGPIRYNISINSVGSLDPAFDKMNVNYLPVSPILNMANGDQSVYRLFNASTGRHYFTAVKSERDNALANGYTSEGVGYYYCKNDSFDVLRLTNEKTGETRLTSSIPEINSAGQNSLSVSVAFSTSFNGTIPVYRLYNPTTDDYFYTTNTGERETAVSTEGYTDQGVSFDSCPSNYQPVYRLYKTSTGDHFYTTDFNERVSAQSAGYKYEEVAYYVPNSPTSTPVYRSYRPNTGDHFYTTDSTEKDTASSFGYNYEEIAYYIDDTTAGIPVYRLYRQSTGNHFYTINLAEKNAAVNSGFRYESIGFTL